MSTAADNAGGSPRSAAGLLLTILGEFVLPLGDQGTWTSTLVSTMADLGVEEKAVRQVLMRTADRGLIRSEKHGRRAQWHLTASGRDLLVDGTERIYAFAGAARDWDGRWLVVLARVPETERGARHHLRSRLGWAGLGKLSAGTWISPHPERYKEVREVLADAGLGTEAHVFAGEGLGDRDPAELAATAWDLGSIEAHYRWFVDEFTGRGPRSDREALTRQIELVHHWRRSLLIDPGLPEEILPADWPGQRAADLFRRRHTEWQQAAQNHWTTLLTMP
jgi:phenylacetic acid degradation operon negative regulatory protein